MRYLIYFLFLSSSILFAQKPFEKGNEHYQKGQYKEAIKAYESVLQLEEKESFELYFNLANCHYKINKVAPAIYNYEKALRLAPNNKEALNNLTFAKKLLIDDIKEVPKAGFSVLLHQFTVLFHYDTWGLGAIIGSVLFLLAFLVYYFTKRSSLKRTFFTLMIVLLFVISILMSFAFFEKNYDENERVAIVFDEKTTLKSEPLNSSPNILILHEGTKVWLVENLKEWQKIQLSDGTDGWIKTNSIKEVR